MSFRRGLRQAVEGLRQARANGAYCIGVADTLVSPIARLANECFIAPMRNRAAESFGDGLFHLRQRWRTPRYTLDHTGDTDPLCVTLDPIL